MNTKKLKIQIIQLAFVGIVLFSLNGCKSDLLDTVPYESISSEYIWGSANLARQAVTGVYNQIRIADYQNNDGNRAMWDTFSQVYDLDLNWRNDLPVLQGNATTSSGLFNNKWRRYYEVIHRANNVIANIDDVPDMSAEQKAQYKAEIKFIRAYYYRYLNMCWRGVPIYLEPINVSECIRPRSSEQEVWTVILQDLTDCINEPNLPLKYAATSGDYGRVTKGAAHALRGKVYMWLEDWEKAEADFKAVGTMGYSLFTGEGGYKALFKEVNERCDEMIFSVQSLPLAGNSHQLTRGYGNRVTAGSAWNNYIVNPAFAESFECADGKPFNWEDVLPGYSSMTPQARSVFFLRDNMTAAEISTMTTFGADMSHYLPDGNEARIKAIFDNRDPRLHYNIITPYSTYLGGIGGVARDYTLRWPYRGSNEGGGFDLQTDTNSKYYYLVRKFVPEGTEYGTNININPIDIPLIRYADVLLHLAEALNEQGKTDEAIPLVNEIRRRVGHQELNTNSYTTVNGQADMRERIRNEWYWELPFEEHLFFHELRWGTWKAKKFDSPMNGMREIWGLATYTYTWGGDHLWVWPIPRGEREMNPNLVQTPGWENL